VPAQRRMGVPHRDVASAHADSHGRQDFAGSQLAE
jgi:hypothetical protein